MGRAELCVIFNPTAGRGRAARRLERLRHLLTGRADFLPSQGPGHAEELAFTAAQAGYATIAAAGGDGTVHEVANGLLRAARPQTALAIFPIGSANDYAHSLGLDATRWPARDGSHDGRLVDVGEVQAMDGRRRYFVNGLGLGFNGAVTLESRRIRHLQGVALYSVALLRALCFRFSAPRMTITLDGVRREVATLALTVNLGRREGGFVLAPAAQLDDGLFDYLHAGPLRRWELLRYLPRMVTGRLPTDHPDIWQGRCKEARVSCAEVLTVHTDGEFFSRPEDDVRSLAIRLLPGALRVHGKWTRS